MRLASSITCALALAAPLGAQAELYRWVDDRGVVNYSNIRPEGPQKVTQVDADSRVSTVPGLAPEDRARQRQLELEARVAQLEQALAEQRAREAWLAAQAPAYPPYYGGFSGYASVGYVSPAWWVPVHRHRFPSHPGFVPRPAFVPRTHVAVRPTPVRVVRR
jgi:hypothetical protein